MKRKLTPKQLVAQAMGGKVIQTDAQRAGITIINERPAGMSFEEYKLLRRKQTKAIRNCLR
jgi:hypothetical protein